MINIYQLFPRLFGNKTAQTVINGTIEQNGCGKFIDISETALTAIKDLGITHIWLTGIIRHATLTSYSTFGIPESHPAIVKGIAGSPYAICDYYDVDPDLATNVSDRMQEFRDLLGRIHQQNLKVIIDFVPNHLAREYKSVMKPENVKDFGEDDNTNVRFARDNNFYYLPEETFKSPAKITDNQNFHYAEFPAKATGNDCFSAKPSIFDWYETVKLNYGFDFENQQAYEGEDVPDTWKKMFEILHYWAEMGIDGFRVDMAEMVPVSFFGWLIPNLKTKFPDLLFIAEIYQPHLCQLFIKVGFDYLYDKVGLYNTIESVLRHHQPAETISECWKSLNGIDAKMLRFMENHDEVRLASKQFVSDPLISLPAVAVSALMHRGPFMIYNGQETGEKAIGAIGFSGDDGRTSIFDYSIMPQHQKWMNGGRFDGKLMSKDQQNLFSFYRKLLHFRLENEAIFAGEFYDLMWANPWYTEFDPRFVYAFLRYSHKQKLLVVINFHKTEARSMRVKIPEDAKELAGIETINNQIWITENIFHKTSSVIFDPNTLTNQGIQITLEPLEITILKLHTNKLVE